MHLPQEQQLVHTASQAASVTGLRANILPTTISFSSCHNIHKEWPALPHPI